MTDRLARALTTASVLLVAAIAATVSFVHIRDLAITHGGDALTAALLPLLIDGTVAAMSLVMLRAAWLPGVTTPWLARFMLALAVGATLAANMAYGAAYGVAGALLWTCPAVFFVGCVEVSVAMVRKTARAPESVTPGSEPAMAAIPPVADAPEPPQPVTSPAPSRPKTQRRPKTVTRNTGAALRAKRHRMHKTGDHALCLAENCPDAQRDVVTLSPEFEPAGTSPNGNGVH